MSSYKTEAEHNKASVFPALNLVLLALNLADGAKINNEDADMLFSIQTGFLH